MSLEAVITLVLAAIGLVSGGVAWLINTLHGHERTWKADISLAISEERVRVAEIYAPLTAQVELQTELRNTRESIQELTKRLDLLLRAPQA